MKCYSRAFEHKHLISEECLTPIFEIFWFLTRKMLWFDMMGVLIYLIIKIERFLLKMCFELHCIKNIDYLVEYFLFLALLRKNGKHNFKDDTSFSSKKNFHFHFIEKCTQSYNINSKYIQKIFPRLPKPWPYWIININI